MPTLYKHKNNTDVAVEVIRKVLVSNKDYIKLHIMWWNIGESHSPYCMNVVGWLTHADNGGNKKNKMKYPISVWENEWEIYEKPIRKD